MGFFDFMQPVHFNADGSVKKVPTEVSKNTKKKNKAVPKKTDFDKQYKHLVKTINLLALELKDTKKLAESKAEKKKLEIAEDRILNIV